MRRQRLVAELSLDLPEGAAEMTAALAEISSAWSEMLQKVGKREEVQVTFNLHDARIRPAARLRRIAAPETQEEEIPA